MKAGSERERVAAALEEDIVFGRLKPRERLVEQDIMDRLETRRHIVRAALELLENRGLVERKANRGAAVRDLCRRDVAELYFMREMLHKAAAEQTALPLAPDIVAALSEIQAKHDAAVADGDVSKAFYQNEDFHALLNKCCDNRVLEDALNYYNERTNLIRSFAFRSRHSLQRSAKEHHQIIEAGASGNQQAYSEAILQHVMGAKAAYLQSFTA